MLTRSLPFGGLWSRQLRSISRSLLDCFIDLKAAYDTVPRSRLWKVCQEYSVSKKLCRLLQALYASTKSAVRVDGELTDWFDVNTGLRQGCILSPVLFNVYIDHVLRRTLDHVEKEERMMCLEEWESKRSGVRLEYRLPDGRRVRGDLAQGEDRIMALFYANHLVLLAENEGSLRRPVMSFEKSTQEFGLIINEAKTANNHISSR